MICFSRNRMSAWMLTGVLGLGGAAALTGCGGDGSSNVAAPTTRHYTSTLNLTAPQTATLSMDVASNNTVTGTLQVNDPTRAARTRAVVVTVQLSGTIAANGDLTLTGTTTPVEGTPQTVRVTGNVGTTGGTLILNYLNQTFNGTWTYQAAVNPGGGGASVTFSNISGSNAITTALNLPLVTGTNSTLPIIGRQLAVSAVPAAGDYSRSLGFGVRGGAVVGTYTIDDDRYSVTYAEGLANPRQWTATGGTLQIISADANKISFKITGATMRAVSNTGTPPGTGTFTLDATGETTALVSN